jgi:hypothetical protein
LFSFFFLQTINFDSPRGGISLVTEKGVLTTSRLLVQKAIPSDSGMINLFSGFVASHAGQCTLTKGQDFFGMSK